MGEEGDVRFVVDVMLGSLARWLRRLGYDVDYTNDRNDSELVRLARAENRVLLTRDRELAARRGVRSLLVESQLLDEQLAQVTTTYPLPDVSIPVRCSVCNSPLFLATADQVEGKVPAYIHRTHTHFMVCPGCRRIFWRGSHWRAMQARLNEIKRRERDDRLQE